MNDSSGEGTAQYGLVMPFVVCDDHGGPFNGAAFVAGFECGALDAMLPTTRALGATVERYVSPAVLPQVDLIAMRHGYTVTAVPWDEHPDEWLLVTLTPGGTPAADVR